MRRVLFLCTGNYYRSRFAEELFNHHVARSRVAWTARSRGLAIERGINNVGSLSPLVVKALADRAIEIRGRERPPQQCVVADLESAARIVALDETEHRPLMIERFPSWENHIVYWKVPDIEILGPETALATIEKEVERLVACIDLA